MPLFSYSQKSSDYFNYTTYVLLISHKMGNQYSLAFESGIEFGSLAQYLYCYLNGSMIAAAGGSWNDYITVEEARLSVSGQV